MASLRVILIIRQKNKLRSKRKQPLPRLFFSPETVTFYMNGQIQESIPNMAPPTKDGRALHLHRNGPHVLFDFQLYSRRLSLSEIKAVYNGARMQGRNCPRPLP